MRRSGKVPSRVDLASYFASHLNGTAATAAAEEEEGGGDRGPPAKVVPTVYSGGVGVASKERDRAQATKHISFAPGTADMAKPIPAAYGGPQQPSPRRPSADVMDYTVKAGVRPSMVRTTHS